MPPAELKALPAAGRLAGSERLFRGPFALQSLYTLGDGDILQQKGRVTGVAADYKDQSGNSTLLVVQYPTPSPRPGDGVPAEEPRQVPRAGDDTPERLVFKDYENKFGVATVKGPRLEVRLHLSRAS